MTDNQKLSDEDRKKQVENLRQEEINDLRSVMKNKGGRRFICKLLDDTGIFKLSFTGNSQTFFNEGQRNIGLMLTHRLQEHCLEDYLLMQREKIENKLK